MENGKWKMNNVKNIFTVLIEHKFLIIQKYLVRTKIHRRKKSIINKAMLMEFALQTTRVNGNDRFILFKVSFSDEVVNAEHHFSCVHLVERNVILFFKLFYEYKKLRCVFCIFPEIVIFVHMKI